jgi:hypothetical protein
MGCLVDPKRYRRIDADIVRGKKAEAPHHPHAPYRGAFVDIDTK